jgi:hypothetical protein
MKSIIDQLPLERQFLSRGEYEVLVARRMRVLPGILAELMPRKFGDAGKLLTDKITKSNDYVLLQIVCEFIEHDEPFDEIMKWVRLLTADPSLKKEEHDQLRTA